MDVRLQAIPKLCAEHTKEGLKNRAAVRSRKPLSALLSLLFLVTVTAMAATESQRGIALHWSVDASGRVILEQASALTAFAAPTRRFAPIEWVVELSDPRGEVLFSEHIPAPWFQAPGLSQASSSSTSFSARLPVRSGATRVSLRNHQGRIVWSGDFQAITLSEDLFRVDQALQRLQSTAQARDAWSESNRSALVQQLELSMELQRNLHVDETLPSASVQDLFAGEPERAEEPLSFVPILPRGCVHVPGTQADRDGNTREQLLLPPELQSPGPELTAQREGLRATRTNQPSHFTDAHGIEAARSSVTLTGRVVAGPSQEMMPWTGIAVQRDGQHQGWINADHLGRFSLELVPESEYGLLFFPPSPFYRKWVKLSLSDSSEQTFEMQPGAVVQGVVTGADGHPVGQSFWMFPFNLNRPDKPVYGVFVNEAGEYQFALVPGDQYRLDFNPPTPFFQKSVEIRLESDANRNVLLTRGLSLTGRVATPSGSGFSQGFWSELRRNNQFERWIWIDASGDFSGAVVPGAYQLRVRPPAPYFDKTVHFVMEDDLHLHINLELGASVIARLSSSGNPLLIRAARVQQAGVITQQWVGGGEQVAMTVEPNLPGRIFLEALSTDPSYEIGSAAFQPLAPGAILEVDINARELLTVHGHVVRPDGQPAQSVELKFSNTGELVKTVLTNWSGAFTIRLPAGQYEIAGRSGSSGALYSEVRASIDLTSRPPGSSKVLDLALEGPLVPLTISVPRGASDPLVHGGRLSLASNGQPVAQVYLQPWFRQDDVLYQGWIRAGTYDLEFHFPGREVLAYPNQRIEGQGLDLQVTSPQRVWRGRVRDDRGNLLRDVDISVHDETHRLVAWTTTDPITGLFALPMGRGLFAEVGAGNIGGRSFIEQGDIVKRIVSLDRAGNLLEEDIVLPTVLFEPMDFENPAVQRVWSGDPTADPFRILFLAEGYTNIIETYQDLNGNGVWDGRLFLDLNGNGVWDAGEPFALYGEAEPPEAHEAGTDITIGNEPFVDINADGVPNLGDQWVFEQNVQAFMRSVFGSHVWSDYPHLFEAYAQFLVSEQAGMGVIDTDGQIVSQRNTLFGTMLDLDRGLLSIDYGLATSIAAEVLPNYDLIVVLINMPVPAGRVNSFLLHYGGIHGNWPVTNISSHELGHAIAFLADEYIEFPGTFHQLPPDLVNVGTPLGGFELPWLSYLGALENRPTVPNTPGTGWFTGGFYHHGGIFRPSQNSVMNNLTPKFNVPSESAVRFHMRQRQFSADGPMIFRDRFQP